MEPISGCSLPYLGRVRLPAGLFAGPHQASIVPGSVVNLGLARSSIFEKGPCKEAPKGCGAMEVCEVVPVASSAQIESLFSYAGHHQEDAGHVGKHSARPGF